MIAAPIPANEEERLAALRRMNLLSTPREADLDRVVRTAQKIFGSEIVLVSLIDRDRQWFKARQGLRIAETARDISFCGHAIAANDMLVVEDATRDDRFHDNPLVTGDPSIRFYAGQPLRNSEGFALGTLCVISNRVREPKPEELEALVDLGRIAEIVLSFRDLGQTQLGLIAELEEAQREALIDPLTGLWNRRGYDRLFEAEIARSTRRGEVLAAVLVDIDHFKKINDTHGHAKGDEVLVMTADLLRRSARASDIVSRYGGEEFAIVARGLEALVGNTLGDRIMRTFRHGARLQTDQGVHPFTISVGIAFAASEAGPAFSAKALFEAADKALYNAKSMGRDRYEVVGSADAVCHMLALP